MAEVVNLRQARKQRDRAAAETEAGQNRARFGRTKGEKSHNKKVRSQIDATLDSARLDKDETPRTD